MSVLLAGKTPALMHAASELEKHNIELKYLPEWDVTDVLLDIPTFRAGGMTPQQLDTMLSSLPHNVRVWGGNLAVDGYECIDLLKDEPFLWENAAITARCALTLTRKNWRGYSVLILGWGRIGTHLAKLLSEQDATVTVAVRKETQKLRLRALGYEAVDYSELTPLLSGFQAVINTVPYPVLQTNVLPGNCTKLDLASQCGISGDDVIWARGLPGIHAPEESGTLIADTFLRLRKEKDA